MDKLLKLIRARSPRANWSRGAQLARSGRVATTHTAPDHIELRVATKNGAAPLVKLFPDDRRWDCECGSDEEVCTHVAAAGFALRLSRRETQRAVGRTGHIGYRFERQDGRLALRRTLVLGKLESPLSKPIAELESQEGPETELTESDRRIEVLLGPQLHSTGAVVPQPQMARLLDALTDAEDIRYHGRPVRIGSPISGLCVRVEECGLGFRLRLDKDPAVGELFQNGALLRGTKLRAVEPHRLGERRFSELRAGKIYEGSEIGTLVSEEIPTLQLIVPLIIDTNKLPKSQLIKPRLEIACERNDDKLVLLASLYYGDPPQARIDADKLTLLSGREAPVRDPEAEGLLRRIAAAMGLEVGIKRSFVEGAAIVIAKHLAGLDTAHVRVKGDAYKEFYDAGELGAQLDIQDSGDFALWFETPGIGPAERDKNRADPARVIQAWERGESLVPLLGGGFARLPTDWLEKFGHRVRDLLAAKEALAEDHVKPTLQLMPDLVALAQALEQPPPPSFQKLKGLLEGFEGIPAARLGPKLAKVLRDYQKKGVAWLAFLRDLELGALLADDMGLGKTLQTLCALKGRSLVVAPTSVIHNWIGEAHRFRPSLKINLYHGPSRKLTKTADITLTTYALLRLDQEVLAAEEWDTVVLDEAQAIKNPTSQVAKAAFALRADFRVALTGTPVENRLEDLWSQFHFINRGLLGGRNDFNERYVKPILAGDQHAAERLRARVRPFILRRLKSEVAKELPPRTEVVLRCELSEPERQVYDAVRAATRKDVVKKLSGGISTLEVLEALLRLRQAASHPGLLPGQKHLKEGSSAKLELLLDTLQEVLDESHKALVFSQWTSLLDLVAQELDKAAITFTRLDGRTRDRKRVVNEFQDPEGPKVMLISLKAGGTGLNLTAADNVFLLDPWWNPAVEDQAADRTHRIGQTRPVIVHRLVAQETVEERILELQEKKRQLADAALAGGKHATQVTREELMALLE